jgi:hypothetical protein
MCEQGWPDHIGGLLWLGSMPRELFSHIFACLGAAATFMLAKGLSGIRFFWQWPMKKNQQKMPSFR